MQEPHFPPNEVIDGDLAHAIHAIEEAARASLAELEAQPLECKVSVDFKVSVRQGRVSVARLGGGDPVAVASGNSWHVFPAIAALLDPTWTTEDLFRAYQVTLVKGSRSNPRFARYANLAVACSSRGSATTSTHTCWTRT